MEFAEHFIREYRRIDRFKWIRRALISFVTGIVMITTGAILGSSNIAPVFILSGFGLLFLAFAFVFVYMLKEKSTSEAFYTLIKHRLWTPILAMTEPLRSIKFTDAWEPEGAFLSAWVAPRGVTKDVYYSLKAASVKLSAIKIAHTVSTGKGTSQSVDFYGYVLQVNAPNVNRFRLKTDRTPGWVKPLKEKIRPDDDASEDYHAEGDYQAWLAKADALKALGYDWIAMEADDNVLNIALHVWRVYPKISKQKGALVAAHQTHLMNLKTLCDTVEPWAKATNSKWINPCRNPIKLV